MNKYILWQALQIYKKYVVSSLLQISSNALKASSRVHSCLTMIDWVWPCHWFRNSNKNFMLLRNMCRMLASLRPYNDGGHGTRFCRPASDVEYAVLPRGFSSLKRVDPIEQQRRLDVYGCNFRTRSATAEMKLV